MPNKETSKSGEWVQMKQIMVLAGMAAGFLIVLSGPQSMADSGNGGSSSADCVSVSADEIAELFDAWNAALQTRDPDAVVALYGPESVLVPTLSNEVRLTPEAKRDYFVHFLEDGPEGTIDQREIRIDCNMAVDIGLYTFAFADTGDVAHARYSFTYGADDGEWAIVSHHSSLMPEPTD